MAKVDKRVSVSLIRLSMAVFSMAVLIFGHYWFTHSNELNRSYNVFGFEITSLMMAYFSLALILVSFITHISGQIVFWCKKDQDAVTRQLMCGPLYINAIYLVLVVVIILL